jgi:pimeloyl-ACP methyl ester carboxylesterase
MTRPRVLLLHGGLGAGDQMAPLADLVAPSLTPAVLDLPGHGAAALDGPFDLATMTARVIAELDHAQQGPVGIFGYSMGGYVALETARRRPDLVRAIVTFATKFAWTPEAAARESRFLDAAKIRAKVPYFADELERRHTALGWEQVLAHTAAMMAALGAAPVLTTEALQGVACPVRMLVGDRDGTVSVEESLAASRAVQNGELEVLPGVAHPFEKAPLDCIARSLTEVLA